jgi:hypothetical protein
MVMNRHIAAFLLAPLAVPFLMSALALQILSELPSLYWFGLLISAVASYAGAIFVGAPAYATLRLRGLTALWLAPVVGSMVGVIIGVALGAILHLALENGILTSIVQIFANGARWGEVIILKPNSMEALVGPAVLGALVGTVLWLIGRPDRP